MLSEQILQHANSPLQICNDSVLAVTYQYKIFRAIISSVIVHVMNMLMPFQRTTNLFSHNKAMLQYLSPVIPHTRKWKIWWNPTTDIAVGQMTTPASPVEMIWSISVIAATVACRCISRVLDFLLYSAPFHCPTVATFLADNIDKRPCDFLSAFMVESAQMHDPTTPVYDFPIFHTGFTNPLAHHLRSLFIGKAMRLTFWPRHELPLKNNSHLIVPDGVDKCL